MATTKNTKKSKSPVRISKTASVVASKGKSHSKGGLPASKISNSAKSKSGSKTAVKKSVSGVGKPESSKAAKNAKLSKAPLKTQKASDPSKKTTPKSPTKASNMRKTSQSIPAKKELKNSITETANLKITEVNKNIVSVENSKDSAKDTLPKRAAKKSAAEVIAKLLKEKHGNKPHKVADSEESDTKAVGRASAGIYFSLEDVDNFLKNKNSVKSDDKYSSSSSFGADKKRPSKRADEPVVVPVPKKALAPASIADILGFNPIEQSRTVFEEKDVPQKWKKYYKLLIEIKERVQNGTSNKVDMVSSDNGELSHENSNQGMDVADIGSKNFERDMALNLMSAEQNIVSEVNAAIERMRNGTYGICEVTGKAIPESRLLAIPFARCTIEGQRQKESELRRMKSGAKREQFGVEMQEDFSSGELSDEDE